MNKLNGSRFLAFANFCALLVPLAVSAETTEVLHSHQFFDRPSNTNTRFDKKAFAETLYNMEVFKLQDPASMDPSRPPFFLDMRDTFTNDLIKSTILSGMIEGSKKFEFDHVCGTPITGRRWAKSFSEKADKKGLKLMIIADGRLEGDFKEGESCLLLDDVLASGKTLMESVRIIRNAGLRVKTAIVAIDKEEGGKEWLSSKENKVHVHSLSKVSELLQILQQSGKFTQEEVNLILNYMKKKKRERLGSAKN